MTTFKGVMRSYGASVRRMERDQQRRNRDAAKRFKEQQKAQSISDAQAAVVNWNDYVSILKSVHKDCTSPIDWNEIRSSRKPEEPLMSDKNEFQANWNLLKYRPSVFDKMFNQTNKKRSRLIISLENAKNADRKEFDQLLIKYNNDLKDWEELRIIADGVENGRIESYLDALRYFNPFSEIGELGAQVGLTVVDDFIDLDLFINGTEVIPDYELNQTSTGKLSKKNMPKTRFNELYQDHICSSVLRAAREVFSCLPVSYVRVNAISKLLNSKTGHMEDKPVLSVIVSSITINTLNLNTIDPSDCMLNFKHNMNFKKILVFLKLRK